MEGKLITAWQEENQSLLYLSAGDYSCGDPNSTLYKKYASSKNPATLVTQDQVNKYWTASLNYLTAYIKLLSTISSGAQTDQATIKSIVSLGQVAAGYIPGLPSGASSALSALGTLASDLTGAIAVGQISAAARKAQPSLTTAVNYLIKYYPSFLQNEQTAFNAWDECANEKLLFIRDQPLGKIKSYQGKYFVAATGFDLDSAYATYVGQKQTFMLDATAQSMTQTLKQILTQNENLADPNLTAATFQSSVQSLNTLYTDFSSAASAIQNFGTPAKPVPAPKPATTATREGDPVMVAWVD
jgi:hypothetical protein